MPLFSQIRTETLNDLAVVSTKYYANVSNLPLSGNNPGVKALVSDTNRLYLWTGAGWYNIALINTNPTITANSNPSYELNRDGTPTVISLTATDPEDVPIRWSYAVTSGSLTNGGGATATVSQAANVFTITPTTNEAYAGAFDLTFAASDGINIDTSSSSFTLSFINPDAWDITKLQFSNTDLNGFPPKPDYKSTINSK